MMHEGVNSQKNNSNFSNCTDETFRLAVEQARESVLIIENNFEPFVPHVVFVNSSFSDITGFEPKEIIGSVPAVFRTLKKDSKKYDEFLLCVKVGKLFSAETIEKKKNGDSFFMTWYIAPILESNGQSNFSVIRQRDISNATNERILIEAKLGRRDEQLVGIKNYAESIVETMRQPLLVLSDSFQVKTANKAFYETFKVDKKDTEDQFLYNLGNGQWNIPELRKLLEEILPLKNHLESYQITHNFPEIGERVMILNARQLSLGEDAENLILLAIEDVTEHVLTIQELKRSNAELESFASVASHDLQEPLRKIQAFSNRLITSYSSDLPSDAKDYLQRIESAGNRMQNLINDLLVLSRISTRAQELSRVDLSLIIREVLSDLELLIENKEASISIEMLPEISADSLQMRQLFQNLLGNALKFQKPDIPPQIHISCQPRDNGHVFTVEDNGIGFDEKYADKIFSIFQRLHSTKEYSGTGIGLAICRKIIERHNGTLSVSSIEDHGTTFTFYLPSN